MGKDDNDEVPKFRDYDYRSNSNVVLTTKRKKRSQIQEPSGEPETLSGKDLHKMGDRVEYSKPPTSAKKKKKQEQALTKKKKQSVLDINTDQEHYNPKTDETRTVYELILDKVQHFIGDVDHETLRGAVDEILTIIHDENQSDHLKQEDISQILSSIPNDEYAKLYQLCKRITDFVVSDVGGENYQGTDEGIAIVSDEEEEDETEGIDDETVGYVVSSDESDSDASDAEQPTIVESSSKMQVDADLDGLDVRSIDAFWLQRELSHYYSDSSEAQKISNDVFDILSMSDDEHDIENQLVQVLEYEKIDLVQKLMKNRLKIIYCTKLQKAANEEEREKIEREMMTNDTLVKILETLRGVKISSSKRYDVGASRTSTGTSNNEAYQWKGERVINLESLSFEEGSHLMSNKDFTLPKTASTAQFKGYEQITIPYSAPEKQKDRVEKLIEIKSLPEWTHRAFPNMTNLNAVQSIIFNSAFFSPENLLICAPTGAGKTNVAVLTMLHEIGLHMDEKFETLIDLDFKMVYIAPMKALVQEVVGNLSERLKPYNIVVQELTGDRNMTKQQIDETQIIVTTPEKWDIVTRKSGDRTYVEKVKLIIIDEIHLLHDERGPVLESIVARTIRQQESTRQNIRLVGLSATLPNYKDVATFLRVKPDNLFYFDSSFRPCPLDQYYIGVNEKKPFKRHKLMNEIVYNKVVEIVGRHQIIVFVHSRKDTYKTAKALRDMAIENDTIGKFVKQGSATSEILKEASQKDANGADLKELLPYGFGVHHAGMTRNDRTLVEDLFDDERLQVLVSTATLAWGVNLPARRVIIKGTQVYSPEKGDWTELSALDVMQMIGRAGRYPRDNRGEGFIVTTQSHLQYYLALLNQQLPIESQFVKSLPDNLNAEIVLGTVQNIDEAVNWLGYTYLYVRMLRNPLLYGITKEDVEHDKDLLQWRRDLVYSAGLTLEKNGLIKFDKRSGDFQPTDLGRVASHYYVTHKSIATFNTNLKPNFSDIELFRLFSLSDEFSHMTVRQEEKLELSKLIHAVPVPIKEASDDPSAKVNVLLQAYISRLRLNGFALIADMTYITQSAARIARALFEIIMHRGWAQLATKVLNLAKMIEHKMWYTQTPLRQFPKIEQTILKQLEGKNTLWERLYDYTPAELGSLVHNNQRGKDLYKYIHQFPRLDLTASVQPITPSTLRIELTISPDFQYNKSIHGSAQTFWIFVEDVDGEVILHHESFVLKQKYAEDNHYVSFSVPIYEPMPPHYFIKVISDRWLHSEQTLPISFRHLILPQKAPTTTELLDLPPLDISALKNEQFENLLLGRGISKFNPIQTQVFRSVYQSEDSVLIAAPGGSGKTLCGILAIMKMFTDHPKSKCIYIAPLETVARKREKNWLSLFEQLGKTVVTLTGNLARDLSSMENGDVIISTPEHFDMFSRKWKTRKSLSSVKLVIADELHMIGGEVGPLLEVVISRVRYMSSQLENTIRIVGLSASILNAKDIADWLGTKKENCFNFHPRYRTIPLEINLQGFTQSSYNARQVAMSKPAYKVIKQKSGGQQTLVFTSSPRQASFIASELTVHLTNDINQQLFVGNVNNISSVLQSVDSLNLREILEYGIAFYHETLTDNDKNIVERLYNSGSIKVLIVTHKMCWGMEQKAKLVIVMGTEYYNGKEHRYADYSIIDMVQMMSRTGRFGQDKDCTCFIFCTTSRKDYFLKFLYEPFPVESHLDHFLYDPLNAEISSKVIENKQGAVDYLTWTFLYRRIRKNPNYYNLSGTTKIHLSDYLSELVESSLEELQKCNCILVEDEDITAMNLGTIASHYYIKHSTIEIYSTTINGKTKLRGLLEVLGYSTEFEQLPIRQKENHILRKLLAHAPLKIEKPNYNQVSTKVNLILQSHFSRTRLTPAMEIDKKTILLNSIKLLRAMVDVIGNEGFLSPALAAMELSQMITQALWDKDPFLMQLPHFTKEICQRCEQQGITTIFDLINMEDDERNQLLLFSEIQMADVAKALNRYPNIELAHEIITASKDISTNSPVTMAIRFDADDVGDEPIFAPYFPEDKFEEWWIVIGDHTNNEIKSIKRLPIKKSSETTVKFLAPSKPGKYEYKLYFMCDSYTGCDQEYPISFTVLEGEDESSDEEMGDEN